MNFTVFNKQTKNMLYMSCIIFSLVRSEPEHLNVWNKWDSPKGRNSKPTQNKIIYSDELCWHREIRFILSK